MIYNRNNNFKAILIFIFIFIFIGVLSIYLLLSAQGFKFSPDKGIVQTGVIEIETIPNNVEVYVNGVKKILRERTVQDVPLGLVDVEITKEGFTSWKKTINIETDSVEKIYAQLYPTELDIRQITSTSIDKLIYSKDYTNIFFTVLDSKVASENGFWKYSTSDSIFNINSNQLTKVSSLSQSLINSLKNFDYSLKISPDSSKVIISIPELNVYSLISLTGDNIAEDLNQISGFQFNQIDWITNTDLLIQNSKIALSVNLNSKQKTLITYNESNKPELTISNNKVYFIEEGVAKVFDQNVVKNVELSGKIKSLKFENIYVSENSDSFLYLLGENSSFFYHQLRDQLFEISGNINILDISHKGSEIIYTNNNKLYTFAYEERTRDFKINEIQNLNIKSSYYLSFTGLNIIELKNLENRVFSISIKDIDGGNEILIVENQKISSGSKPHLANDNKTLYYVLNNSAESEDPNNNLYSIDLTTNKTDINSDLKSSLEDEKNETIENTLEINSGN